MTVNHMPWDNGAIHDALDDVLGFHMPNKTKKTRCGVRVANSRADHKAEITCVACLADMKREQDFIVSEKARLGL